MIRTCKIVVLVAVIVIISIIVIIIIVTLSRMSTYNGMSSLASSHFQNETVSFFERLINFTRLHGITPHKDGNLYSYRRDSLDCG
jgi:hypothetical protein